MRTEVNLLVVYPCKNGDKLEIYKSRLFSGPSYFLTSKKLGNCQGISEYEARTILHEDGFLFCEVKLTDHAPTIASGELTTP